MGDIVGALKNTARKTSRGVQNSPYMQVRVNISVNDILTEYISGGIVYLVVMVYLRGSWYILGGHSISWRVMVYLEGSWYILGVMVSLGGSWYILRGHGIS